MIDDTSASLKVSVVVPAYNSGTHIERLVDSLVRQSMPPTQFEAIFVDDGSTDDTPARLDALAAAHPHFRVLHIDNSGWPSRPRNVGVAHARGEYVVFVDDDDWLGDEALDRMYGIGATHGADVVIGRMTGHGGRGVPRELFRKNRFDATVANAPLIDSLTCHKMFRRAFLDEHELRFPEGWPRRLEDHRMVVRAYLLSKRTCVLSDYTCYHHSRRDDGGNVTADQLDPGEYYAALREALDIVDAHVEPGPLRDRLHRRWLRHQMLDRLRGRRLLEAPQAWVGQVAAEVRDIIRERFGPGVAAGLPPMYRVLAHLAEQDRLADVRRLAEWEQALRAAALVERHALAGTTLTLTVAAWLESDGRPVAAGRTGDRDLLVLPVENVPAELRDVTEALVQGRVDVVARRQGTGDEVFLPVTSTVERVVGPDGTAHAVHRATVTVDYRTVNAGRTAGMWRLKARVTSLARTQDVRLPLLVRCATDGAPPRVVDETAFLTRLRQAVRRRVRAGLRALPALRGRRG
ncbi:glycosyltransferase family 2 protein [Micromonospora avicenniae]|uniref:Glycosyl transferase family 2 n=1 Tax=Micromonospora avicenniae TaxID=1198245 RepID=A0A1N6PYN5_9ACTN|nr:glycosyltransferase family A protein [Micromonospora avicenniae]SIQ09428.1 Glycosyl transferase family 2 [Micromonospora avicenniae]